MFAFTGSASNVTSNSLMALTSSTASATGGITLSNACYNGGFQTAFVLSNASTPSGTVSYNFGDATTRLEALFNQSSNTLALTYNGTNLSTSNVTLSGLAHNCVVRYNASPSNVSIRSYVNSVQVQNFNTATPYNFSSSNFTHSWVGSNAAGSAKYIAQPLVNSIQSFFNPVEVQGSLKANNITEGGSQLSNKYQSISQFSAFSNWVSPLVSSAGGATGWTVGASKTTTSCNVGIALTNPAYPLDVYGTARASSFIAPTFQCSAGYMNIQGEYDIRYFADFDGNNGGASHVFYSSSNEKMRITSAGNVGIGTASPAFTLDVNGTINATTYNNLPSTANYASFSNWVSPLASSGWIASNTSIGYTTCNLPCATTSSYVGIQTPNPAYPLTVNMPSAWSNKGATIASFGTGALQIGDTTSNAGATLYIGGSTYSATFVAPRSLNIIPNSSLSAENHGVGINLTRGQNASQMLDINGDALCRSNFTVSNNLKVAGTATLNTFAVNNYSQSSNAFVGWSHASMGGTDVTKYNFAADSNGVAYINAAAGTGIAFRIGNVQQASINADGSLWLGAPASGAYSFSNQGTMCTSNLDVKGAVTVSQSVTANQLTATNYFTVESSVNLAYGGLFQGGAWSQTFNSLSPSGFTLSTNGGYYQRMGKIVVAMGNLTLQVTGSAITNFIFRIQGLPIAVNGLNMVTGCFTVNDYANSGAIAPISTDTISLSATGTFATGYHSLSYTITYVC